MRIDRRRFLAWSAALGLPGAPAVLAAAAQAEERADGEPCYVTARRRAGRHEAVVLDARGADLLRVPMPDRGHSFALDAARGRAVVFGRQPGFFAVAFDVAGRRPPQPLAAAEGRHFYGHGVFLPDGRRMLATENDYENGRAVLGVYDASPGGGYRRLGEFDVGGVGSHEVVLLPDGKTLCVANGGILTHPDYGKLELNLDSMRPSLAYLDAADGRLLEKAELDASLHQLSLRHLGLAGDGAVWFGCQHVGPDNERPALVGRHRRGHAPELFPGPAEVLRDMRHYIGTVAADASGHVMATSSPVGGQVMYWDAASGRYLGVTKLPDGCGVAPRAQGHFLASSGLGAMVHAGPGIASSPVRPTDAGLAWDNHFRRL
ncbi:DUF1513 domain-containing protein [Bordetella genomosp. 13]|uniref:DUF1513 domain-containing protein n=1 Tax=Bordetella genomosp. 13 TaxID=463040 RepID=UPI0011A4B34E|nr:DUF1513 domain-containing protein [Bordetella genomosp. 13]